MSGVPILRPGRREPSKQEVDLGAIEGAIEIDLSAGVYFKATVADDVDISFVNGPSRGLTLDLTMGAGGGHAVTWGATGLAIVDPSGALGQQFVATTAGARSVGLWSASATEVFAFGYNSTS